MADLARRAAVSARAADAAIAAMAAVAPFTAVPACNGNDAEALVRQLQRKRLPVPPSLPSAAFS